MSATALPTVSSPQPRSPGPSSTRSMTRSAGPPVSRSAILVAASSVRDAGFGLPTTTAIVMPARHKTRVPHSCFSPKRRSTARGSRPDARLLGTMAADLIIRNGTVVDGSGGPARRADVAIAGDRIVAVEDHIDEQAHREIDAEGRVVTPG